MASGKRMFRHGGRTVVSVSVGPATEEEVGSAPVRAGAEPVRQAERPGSQVAIQVATLSKNYGTVRALRDASFNCRAGEVHGLVGQNGAGKSTLVKILSGLVRPDRGEITVWGRRVSTGSSRQAREAGVATVFQELALLPHRTVARNVFLGREPQGSLGFVSDRRIVRLAGAALAGVGIDDIDPSQTAGSLPLSTQQRLSIGIALAQRPRVLILDEPTSALGPEDVDWLEGAVRELKEAGKAVLVITHRLAEIRRFCDRVTVLRDGTTVGTQEVDSVSDDDVVRMMIGRGLARRSRERTAFVGGSGPLLETMNLCGSGFYDINLSVRPGEIVGIAGLEGQGHRELFLTLAGAQRATAGILKIDGEAVSLRSPREAIRRGVALVPEDRKSQGLFVELSGKENASLPSLRHFTRAGTLDLRAEERAASEVFAHLGVTEGAVFRPVKTFSGGNQQKILFGKWLLSKSRVLLLYDPTRGVDIGAKQETYALIDELVHRDRVAVLMYSTELEELLEVPDSVLAMRDGMLTMVFEAGQEAPRSEEALLRAMMGLSHWSRWPVGAEGPDGAGPHPAAGNDKRE